MTSGVIERLLTVVAAYILYQLVSFYHTRSKVKLIPTIGSEGFFFSYIWGWRNLLSDDSLVKTGYKQFAGKAFKMPNLTTSSGWMIVVNGEKMVDELRKAPNDILSFQASTTDNLQTEYLLGHHNANTEPFEVEAIKKQLTRSFAGRFADLTDEISASCQEYLPDDPTDWKDVEIHHVVNQLVTRTTNRLFVGLPLCRDEEFLKHQEDWAMGHQAWSQFMHMVPFFLKPIIGAFIRAARPPTRKTEEQVGPIIAERLSQLSDCEDQREVPNDLITWLIQTAKPENRNVPDISLKILQVNFAAIHTTAVTLVNAFFDLTARPEYIHSLKDEMIEVIGQYGWTKDAMGRLRKTDSFLKESSRMAGTGTFTLTRFAKKDFSFSDGTTIPAGFTVAASTSAMHFDEDLFEDPYTFNGFRFSDMREKGSGEYDPLRHQMVSLGESYLLFGHGKQACPGRFFAVNEVKAVFAHILLNYDIQLPGGAREVPPPIWFGGFRMPNPTAKIMFRKRKTD